MASPANVRLESFIAGLKEQVHVLKTFNAQDQVNHYCDLIEADLQDVCQSQVKHLTDLLTKSLEKVRDYRKKLLDRSPFNESRNDDQDNSRLIAEVDSFLRAIGEVQPANQSIPDSIRDVQLFNLKIKRALSEARRAAFNGSFLNLKSNDTFKQQDDLLGLLVESDRENIPGNLEMIHEKTFVDTPLINSIILLDDGRVVTGTNEKIKLWKDDSLQSICEITSLAICLLQLSGNRFVCGLLSGRIQLLVAEEDNLRTVLSSFIHSGIFHLRAYGDRVISFSSSDLRIMIWDSNLEFDVPIFNTQIAALGFAFDTFSHSLLATTSCDVGLSVQVWDFAEGIMLQSINTCMRHIKSLLALANYYMVMVSSDDETRVLDLISGSVIRIISHEKSMLTGQLVRLRFEYALASFCSSTGSTINLFDRQTGQLLQLISLNDSNTARCLNVARDNTKLILAMADGTIKILRL